MFLCKPLDFNSAKVCYPALQSYPKLTYFNTNLINVADCKFMIRFYYVFLLVQTKSDDFQFLTSQNTFKIANRRFNSKRRPPWYHRSLQYAKVPFSVIIEVLLLWNVQHKHLVQCLQTKYCHKLNVQLLKISILPPATNLPTVCHDN